MNRDISTILPVSPLTSSVAGRTPPNSEKNHGFEHLLQRELAAGTGLKFSAHAEKRLLERKIVLAGEDLARIDQAVRNAEAKGARESLIIYGDLALITSIKNKTVVTAIDGGSFNNHVFTNIDSAVIIK